MNDLDLNSPEYQEPDKRDCFFCSQAKLKDGTQSIQILYCHSPIHEDKNCDHVPCQDVANQKTEGTHTSWVCQHFSHSPQDDV